MAIPATRPQQQSAAPKPSRMTLSNLVKGPQETPSRIVLYGVEGVGKSTFAANAPSPIFIGAEDGTSQLDVARFPQPETWSEILEAVRTLTNEGHDFRTLVLDTLDWAEPLCWDHVCQKGGKAAIEDFGYGKGYVAAIDEWRILLAALEALRRAKGMNVVLLAHSWIKKFQNPNGEDFDRYEMKLHAKAAGLIKEWSDAVLFAMYELVTAKDERTKRTRGFDTGKRVLYTTHRAAWDAKNRYSLPEMLPLDWAEFAAGVSRGAPASADELRAEIRTRAEAVGGDDGKRALEAIARAGDDTAKLAQLLNWITTKETK